MNDSECVEYKFQHHEKYFEKMNTDLERMTTQIEDMNIRLTIMETQLVTLTKLIYAVPTLMCIITFIINYLDAVMHL